MADVADPRSETRAAHPLAADPVVVDDDAPRWRGINHLALVTADMDATVRFYHGVLGMRVVASLSSGPMRHYFFEIGPQNTVAFFEWDGVAVDTESIVKSAGIPPTFPTQFDHISFNLPDEQALIDLQERLTRFAVGVTSIVDHGFMQSVYFTDPNGIALEASHWVIDPTGRPATYDDRAGLFTDAHPVPAMSELASTGDVEWTPATELVDEGADPA
jgi:catechol 2,3-dioxygenase-like lactoylglutathione lyase family enzyme